MANLAHPRPFLPYMEGLLNKVNTQDSRFLEMLASGKQSYGVNGWK